MGKYRTGIFGVMGSNPRRDGILGSLHRQNLDLSQICNPQVARGKWTQAHQVEEDEVKHSGIPLLYILGSPAEPDRTSYSSYGVWQAVGSLYDPRVQTLIHFDPQGLDERTAKSYKKIMKDLADRWPGALADTWESFVERAADCYRRTPALRGILLGTGGVNPWPGRFLAELGDKWLNRETRINPAQIFNPLLGPNTWNETLQVLEDQARANATHHFFFLGDPGEKRELAEQLPAYSILETRFALQSRPAGSVAVYFDMQSTAGHGRDALLKIQQDMARDFPDTTVFVDNQVAAEEWLKQQLV